MSRELSPPSTFPAASGTETLATGGNAGEQGAIRIFYLVDSFNVGGSELQAVQAACQLNGGSCEVTVGCLRLRGPLLELLRRAAIPVYEFSPGNSLLSLSGLYQLLRLAIFLRRRRFQVVHTHDLWSNLLGVPAAWLARIPVVISSRRDLGHLDWYTPRRMKVIRLIHRLSNVVVANSAAVREFVVRENHLDPRKIRILSNGVDFERFASARGDRQKLFPAMERSAKLVAVVANMRSSVKGHTYLIEAARRVCRVEPRTRLLLIGEGDERPQIENQVRELGLESNVLFLGNRKDVPELLSCCDLAVLSSISEGFPNAILEYMAAGLPVVATRTGGVEEIIEDDVSGLLVPPRNHEALADAILRLLREPKLARQLGRAGQEKVRNHYSLDRLLWKLRALYAELLAGGMTQQKPEKAFGWARW